MIVRTGLERLSLSQTKEFSAHSIYPKAHAEGIFQQPYQIQTFGYKHTYAR